MSSSLGPDLDNLFMGTNKQKMVEIWSWYTLVLHQVCEWYIFVFFEDQAVTFLSFLTIQHPN